MDRSKEPLGLAQVTSLGSRRTPMAPRTGRVVGINPDGRLLVDFEGNGVGPLPARRPFAIETLLELLSRGPMRRRRLAALELAIRTHSECAVETRTWAREQERALAAVRLTVRAQLLLGAATGGSLVALAVQYLARKHLQRSQALVWAASDDGERRALLLERI